MPDQLTKLQKLILDIVSVERHHYIPDLNKHENVVEHSFTLAMLCWRLFELVKPELDLNKIFKYALVHDFPERGNKKDVNTYASQKERDSKHIREKAELEKISAELSDFEDFVKVLNEYEIMNAEARFVWTVDKMTQLILGQIDNWRPYREYGISFDAFCTKNEEFLEKASPYLKEIFRELFENCKKTYHRC
jgi:5'-deoxynucleotidase YfbR-like HD superfamily hydrolase